MGWITAEMNSRLFLLAIPLAFLLGISANNAFAWGYNQIDGQPSWLGGIGQEFHHWLGSFNNGQGYQPNNGCGAYCQGQQDAQYDHEQSLVYNPYPQCCHSEFYNEHFREGYTQRWNTYQSQEQQTDQRSNIYINNSPGAYVNTAQSSNQGQGQSQEQGPTWTSSSPQCQQCLNTDNVNGDCSNGCPWGQGP